jgi:hypothetical protein
MHVRFNVPKSLPAALLSLLIAACASGEEGKSKAGVEPPGTAAPSASAQADLGARARVSPRLGGSVTLVGDYQTELAVHEDGSVEGLVFDADAKVVPPERIGSFGAVLALDGSAQLPVALSWDAGAQRFRGHADLVGELATRPIDVKLAVDGKAQSGMLDEYVLLPKLELQAGGEAKALADAKLGAPAAGADAALATGSKTLLDAKAKAGKAKADVKAGVKAKASVSSKAKSSANVGASAKAKLAAPKVTVAAASPKPAAKDKAGASANVKAKASFGFGN